MRYRKKPVEVEAVQWTGSNYSEVYALHDPEDHEPWRGTFGVLTVPTLRGEVEAEPGDWIVRGPSGDFWPVKPAIFDETYESVDG